MPVSLYDAFGFELGGAARHAFTGAARRVVQRVAQAFDPAHRGAVRPVHQHQRRPSHFPQAPFQRQDLDIFVFDDKVRLQDQVHHAGQVEQGASEAGDDSDQHADDEDLEEFHGGLGARDGRWRGPVL